MAGMSPAKTARKAAKPPAGTGTVRTPRAVPVPVGEEPPELRDFYGDGPPKLSRPRGAGTTGVDSDLSLDFDTKTEAPAIPMEKLFSIDDVDYFWPIEFPPAYSLVYLDALEQGRDIAVGKALKLAVGYGWQALINLAETRPDLITDRHLQVLMDRCLTRIMGSIEESGEGNG